MVPAPALSPVMRRRPRGAARHDRAAALLRALLRLVLNDGYRPERHYMRGGRTPGARSLARA